MKFEIVAIAALVGASTYGPPAVAGARGAPDVGALAEELAELRGAVEELSTGIQAAKEAQQMRLRSLGTQKADLEIELRREALRLEQLRGRLDEHRAQAEEAAEAEEALAPAVVRALSVLREAVSAGLPYRVPDRLGALDELETRLSDGVWTPGRAVARLWSSVEDELRITGDSALDRQVVRLDGDEILADVLRVGTVMIFFRAPEERYGYAEHSDSGWSWRQADAKADVERLRALFDSFDKRVREGLFEIPNPLAEARR